MNALLVPTLGLDLGLLDRLAASLDYPIKNKVIINNGDCYALMGWASRHLDWTVLLHPENLGVAGSWNLCPLIFPDEDAWLICNDDVAFPPGYLKRMCDFSDAHAKDFPLIFTNNTHGYYCFTWTKKGVQEHGTFDENFWPAYYEDCDMNMRLRLAGATCGYACNDLPPMVHGKPKCGGIEYNAMLQGVGLFNRRYWEHKWGTSSTTEPVNKTPFGWDASLSYWELDKARRAQMQPLFDQFMSQAKPSLYD